MSSNSYTKWLLVAVVTYISLFSFLSFLKYYLFLYDSIDLVIFNQVFWNTIHGAPFWFTITFPHSYLADHVSLLMMLELPLYALFQHPVTLLILQTIALAGAAVPLFFISKTFWRQTAINQQYANPAALGLAILWLLNPLVHNINLLEYHELAFFPLFAFLAVYGYLEKKKSLFLIGYALAATIREDTGIMLIGFITIMALDMFRSKKDGNGRRARFVFASLTISAVSAITAYTLVGLFSPEGTRYTSYFSWLGGTIPAILQTLIFHPLMVLKHLFSVRNIMVAAVPLLPLFFLPILRPKYLLLAAVPLGALFLTNPERATLSYIYLHYSATVLPGFFVAAAAAAASYWPRVRPDRVILSSIVIAIATIYAGVRLGPLVPTRFSTMREIILERQEAYRQAEPVDPYDSIAAPSWLLSKVSSRRSLYGLHHLYSGNIEFTDNNYEPPCNVDRLILSQTDLAELVLRNQFMGYANLTQVQKLISCSQPKIDMIDELAAAYDISAPTPILTIDTPLITGMQAVHQKNRIILSGTAIIPNAPRLDTLFWRVEAIDPKTGHGLVVFQLVSPLAETLVPGTINFSIAITSPRFVTAAASAGEVRLFLVHNRTEMYPAWLNSFVPIIPPPLSIYDSIAVKVTPN